LKVYNRQENMYYLDGCWRSKKLFSLEVVGAQENYFPWRLLALKQTTFLGGHNISLALWQIKSARSFLGG
jgi:hypothetical protein